MRLLVSANHKSVISNCLGAQPIIDAFYSSGCRISICVMLNKYLKNSFKFSLSMMVTSIRTCCH
jgi:hypothetical protein